MRIDGLHPNASTEADIEFFIDTTWLATREGKALPKHIHIKPNTTDPEYGKWCCTPKKPDCFPLASPEVQPTEEYPWNNATYEYWRGALSGSVLDALTKEIREDDHEGSCWDTVNMLAELLIAPTEALIADRERKAAVSALLKLHTHNRDTETIADVRRLIAEYERKQ